MDNKKELEQMVDSLMKNDGLLTPSTDFTKNVVAKALANQTLFKKRYQPLLPKWTWYLLCCGVLGLMLFGLQQYSPTGNVATYNHYSVQISNWSAQFFERMRFSKIVVYVAVVGGALTCLQTMVLKNYWNSKLS